MAFPGSPLPSPLDLLTPPDSPWKRRQVLRESEESHGDMMIENYLLSSDPYRSISLPVPWPYPFLRSDASRLQLRLAALNNRIREILTDYGFSDSVLFHPVVARKPLYPGEDHPVNLLFVFFGTEDNAPPRLGPAKDALLQLLYDNGINDMNVEIANMDLIFKPSLFPLRPEHPVVLAYERAKSRVIDILDTRLCTQWRVLCPFNVGCNENKVIPSIVVMVDPLSFADWSNLAFEIHSEVSRYKTDDLVNVEFLPGDLSMLQGPGVSYAERLGPEGIPEMGFLIGIRGDNNAGTLGEYLSLTRNGRLYRGTLTNYHVVWLSNPKSGRDILLDSLERRGLSPSQPLGRQIQIESLVRTDRDKTLAEVHNMLKGFRDSVEEYAAKLKSESLSEQELSQICNVC